jgi:hypothetical protein
MYSKNKIHLLAAVNVFPSLWTNIPSGHTPRSQKNSLFRDETLQSEGPSTTQELKRRYSNNTTENVNWNISKYGEISGSYGDKHEDG